MSNNNNNRNRNNHRTRDNNNPNRQNNFTASINSNLRQSYDMLITNYPKDNYLMILDLLNESVRSNFGAYPTILNKKIDENEIIITVLNHIQYDALLQLSGSFVCNYPIWITKYHQNDKLDSQKQVFGLIFQRFSNNGIVELSGFADKFSKYGGDPSIVNFNNRDFVEFLLFRLGTESRDKRFWVSTLYLENNGIKTISPWVPFLHFLPNLKQIKITNNPIEYIDNPILPEYLQIFVEYNNNDSQVQTQYNGGNPNYNLPQPAQDNLGPPWIEGNYPPLQEPANFPTVQLQVEDDNIDNEWN